MAERQDDGLEHMLHARIQGVCRYRNFHEDMLCDLPPEAQIVVLIIEPGSDDGVPLGFCWEKRLRVTFERSKAESP